VFDMCGLDVGYSNPIFAWLEIDYGESDSPFASWVTGKPEKNLILYELDLGLNHLSTYVNSNYSRTRRTWWCYSCVRKLHCL
jgi:splicing factor 3B subunit 3